MWHPAMRIVRAVALADKKQNLSRDNRAQNNVTPQSGLKENTSFYEECTWNG
jgi:hypothetical protein